MNRKRARRLRRKIEGIEKELSKYVDRMNFIVSIDPMIGYRISKYVRTSNRGDFKNASKFMCSIWEKVYRDLMIDWS